MSSGTVATWWSDAVRHRTAIRRFDIPAQMLAENPQAMSIAIEIQRVSQMIERDPETLATNPVHASG